jgi:hypothetical protein
VPLTTVSRQLDGIQRSERIIHSVGSNERLSVLHVAEGQQNDFETAFGKIGKEEAAQLIECCFINHSRSDFGGNDRLDFDQRQLGKDKTGARGLNERVHPFTPDLGMVELRQSAAVKKVAWQLKFVPLQEEVRFE